MYHFVLIPSPFEFRHMRILTIKSAKKWMVQKYLNYWYMCIKYFKYLLIRYSDVLIDTFLWVGFVLLYLIFSFMCIFYRSLFVLLSFFFWPLCCLSFFELRILITPFSIFNLFLGDCVNVNIISGDVLPFTLSVTAEEKYYMASIIV